MFRRLKKYMRQVGISSQGRRKRRYAPSLSVSADYLENRQLLTTGLGKEPVAAIASAPRAEAHSPLMSRISASAAELLVISQYESILLRTPTASEMNTWVPELHAGAISQARLRNL